MIIELINKAKLKDWELRVDYPNLSLVRPQFSICCFNYYRKNIKDFFKWLDEQINLCDEYPKIWRKNPTEKDYKRAEDEKQQIIELKNLLTEAYKELLEDLRKEFYGIE